MYKSFTEVITTEPPTRFLKMLKLIKQHTLGALKTAGVFNLVKSSRWRGQRLLILAYHGFSLDDEHCWDPEMYLTVENLRERFQILKDGDYNVVRLDEGLAGLRSGKLPLNAVALTFDDGNYDFYKLALPLIKEFQFPATLYLTTYYCDYNRPVFPSACSYILWKGREGFFDGSSLIGRDFKTALKTAEERSQVHAHITEFASQERMSGREKDALLRNLATDLNVNYDEILQKRILHLMNPKEVKEISREGVDVQMHTHTHRLPKDRRRFIIEIEKNRDVIKEYTGATAKHFCYPSGAQETIFSPWLEELGVSSATTCEPALCSREVDVFALPRLVDTSSLSSLEFEGWLTGISHFLPQRAR